MLPEVLTKLSNPESRYVMISLGAIWIRIHRDFSTAVLKVIKFLPAM